MVERVHWKAKLDDIVNSDLIFDMVTLIMGGLFVGSSVCIILMAAGFIVVTAWAQAFPESAVLAMAYMLLQYSTDGARALIVLITYVVAAWIGSAAYCGGYEILYYFRRQKIAGER